jgi:hypothetical protein
MTDETSPAAPDPIPAVTAPGIADDMRAAAPAGSVTAGSDGTAGSPWNSPADISAADTSVQADFAAGSEAVTSLNAEVVETGEAGEHTLPDPPGTVDDVPRTGNPYGRYAAIAALPADSLVSIAAAGLVAHKVGSVSVAQQIRMRDVISGTRLDRSAIRNNPFYLEAKEWSQAWDDAVSGLPDNRVIIVAAPRGHGSTTFSLRLLACHAIEDTELIQLEADWKSPKIDKLPLQENCAYQLDLQDPDHDRFDSTFLNGLGKHAMDLNAVGSYLVLAVADELWSGHHGQVPPGITVLRLDDPPDALEVVDHRLTAEGLDFLVPYALQPEAAKHIQGRDAVQAVRAVSTVVREWHELGCPDIKAAQHAQADSLPVEGTVNATGQQAPELDPDLRDAIQQALGNWQDDLDKLFGEPGRESSNRRSLSPQDRCLLMSLAMHQSGTAPQIESAALALESTLDKSHPEANSKASGIWEAFSRRGLRPRLRAFQAAIDGRDKVTFNRPGYAEAVLTYVWDNYSGLRNELITWMVGCAAEDSQYEDPAARRLTALILRLQDTERLTSLRDNAIDQGRLYVIVRVMAAAAADEHMGRRARNLLYDWASQRPTIQHVVIAVCRELISVQKDIALVRLRRVASHATDDDVRAHVLAAFREVAADQKLTERFSDAVASWQEADPVSRATKLGLLALLGTESEGLPWIPSQSMAIDVTAGLRQLLADLRSFPETVPVIVTWMRLCGQDSVLYAKARALVAAAIRDQHAFNAGITVMKELAEVTTPDGGSVGEDLYAEIVRPELRSFHPLTRPET